MASKTKPVAALRKAMVAHGLRQRDVAELCGVSLKTVESWLADPESANHRVMPARHLLVLQLVLRAENKNKKGKK